MIKINKNQILNNFFISLIVIAIISGFTNNSWAQIKLEKEVKITDSVMFFDGNKVDISTTSNNPNGYDYVYGNALTPHGDCIKAYKNFVFLTWYRGGKDDRHVMLTRYNMETGVSKTIEFPHQHTGYNGKWWIGETHNTIGIGICPKDSTVHMLYDMHRNGNVAAFENDYLRYSYTETGGATVPDEEFTIERFVNSDAGNYKHLNFNGINNETVTKLLTYPAFFTNDEGDLFMKNRFGYSENGRFLFARYDGEKWHGYTDFNRSNATNYGVAYNWGLYGDIKYVNGKIRIGFQRRQNNKNDKYQYQNGIYYAYSDDPTGLAQWKDHKGNGFTRPLADADVIKVAEPGDWVQTTQKNQVYIVGGFDWTVTDNEDVHIVSMVKDKQYNVTKKLHTYKSANDEDFTTVEYSAGSELYAAGNDVYVIGLNNGRVNIVKTKGGTSDFQQMYQHTSGPTFDKGVANVYDGKLYYYLKKSGGSGDKRTTYLQVFDLDIDVTPPDTTRYLRFKNLNSGQEFPRGTNLKVKAEVGTAFKEVSLFSGDENLGTLTSSPYEWTLENMVERVYDLKLVAKDSAETTVERSIVIYTPEVFVLSNKKSIHVNFEDEVISSWETDGNDYGVVPSIIENTNTRTGSKVLAFTYSDRTSGHHVQNIVDKIGVPDQHYFHLIAYCATSDISAGTCMPTAKLGDWTPTPTFMSIAAADVFERKITSRQNTQGEPTNCYPRMRSRALAACTIYYDDIVLYTSTNEEVDLTPPTAPTDLKISGVELNWNNGSDAETEIVSTLILRSENLSTEAPILLPQVAYGENGEAYAGEWEIIETLEGESRSYSDSNVVPDVKYAYAIVHKDLAYNYSEAIVGTEYPTALAEQKMVNALAYGKEGAIRIVKLKPKQKVRIFDINGRCLMQKTITENSFEFAVNQGVYVVNVSGKVSKVIVR